MECKIPDYAGLWRTHILSSNSLRMKDDQAEADFWHRFIKTKTYAPDPSSRRVLQYLRPIFQEYAIETSLELGPGWGNYTLDLAKFCRETACVDISQDVLDFVIQAGREHGLPNITGFCSKWEDFQPERKYDLVFGYNCFYRQEDLAACFEKMNRTAVKLCVAGMNTGTLPGWVGELEKSGAQVSWDFKDYFYFTGVLYQMGICSNTRVLTWKQTLTYDSLEEMVSGELNRCSVIGVDFDTAAPVISRYFTREPDGKLTGCAEFHSGIVWWEPVKLQEHPDRERFLRT